MGDVLVPHISQVAVVADDITFEWQPAESVFCQVATDAGIEATVVRKQRGGPEGVGQHRVVALLLVQRQTLAQVLTALDDEPQVSFYAQEIGESSRILG